MEWVEGCGLDKYLIRISIGVEDADDLLTRVAEALKLA
jgi:cystathionine beta-lyase/cystathionine gamma-synthase